jgi:threonine dehydratase
VRNASPGAAADDGDLVTLADIRLAAERVRGVALRTPLLPFGPGDPDDPRGRARAWLKPESLQPVGAFKIRGAYNAIAQLPAEHAAAGVVTHSSGNHAQGVARAARLLGVRAVIVMPDNAPSIKVERVRADGAEIVFVGASSEERAERAAALVESEGLSLVAPFDDARVIAGQGTVGLEIVEQVDELDAAPTGDQGDEVPEAPGLTVLVPIGGGGIASGVATAVKALRQDAAVFGVEPELAADARDSLREGRLVRWEPELVGRTIADGMRSTQVGRLPFAHLSRYLDGVVTVGEDEIATAMARAADDARLVLEPSGATALAAWLFHGSELPAGRRVVCVLTGGNVDPERWTELVARGRARATYREAAARSAGV